MHKIIICSHDEKLIPIKKTDWSVCWDLKIAKDFNIWAWEYGKVGTWVKVYMPIGWHCKIYARSGLPGKMGLMKANHVGVMDSDYRGEYILQFYNFTKEDKTFDKYTRLSQIEFAPYYIGSEKFGQLDAPKLEIIIDQETYDNFADLYPSQRGEWRFNSTGHN